MLISKKEALLLVAGSKDWLTENDKPSHVTRQQEDQLNKLWEGFRKQNLYIHPFYVDTPQLSKYIFVENKGKIIFFGPDGKAGQANVEINKIIRKHSSKQQHLKHKSTVEKKKKEEEDFKKHLEKSKKRDKDTEKRAKKNKELQTEMENGIYTHKSPSKPPIMIHNKKYYYWNGMKNWLAYPARGRKGALSHLSQVKDDIERDWYKKTNKVTKKDLNKITTAKKLKEQG